ncbi:MAG: four helix bundle protein [Synergistaceae bacterium]|nr:four helix bundle protein [Synergistaceae bacterium]
MTARHYRELIVWQKAMKAARLTYSLVKKLPKEELYSLSDQMRRAAVSIPSNIAEGQARNTTKDFLHFLAIANGSRTELETQLLLCVEIGYLTEQEISETWNLLQEVGKMLHTMMRTLQTY